MKYRVEELEKYLLLRLIMTEQKKGFDLKLYDKINKICNLPLIISGGMGKPEDLLSLNNFSDCNAVAVGTILHYDLAKIHEIKEVRKKI